MKTGDTLTQEVKRQRMRLSAGAQVIQDVAWGYERPCALTANAWQTVREGI